MDTFNQIFGVTIFALGLFTLLNFFLEDKTFDVISYLIIAVLVISMWCKRSKNEKEILRKGS